MNNTLTRKAQQRNAEFRELRKRGWTIQEIATHANLSRQRVDMIVKNKLKPSHNKGTVYVVQAGTAIKIGVAKDVGTRLKQLQMGCPIEVKLLFTLPGGRELESDLHRRFGDSRLWGEWFNPSKELEEFIDEHLCTS